VAQAAALRGAVQVSRRQVLRSGVTGPYDPGVTVRFRGCSPRLSSPSSSRNRFTARWWRGCRAPASFRSSITSSLPIWRCSGDCWPPARWRSSMVRHKAARVYRGSRRHGGAAARGTRAGAGLSGRTDHVDRAMAGWRHDQAPLCRAIVGLFERSLYVYHIARYRTAHAQLAHVAERHRRAGGYLTAMMCRPRAPHFAHTTLRANHGTSVSSGYFDTSRRNHSNRRCRHDHRDHRVSEVGI
jgi:hypothetical protein